MAKTVFVCGSAAKAVRQAAGIVHGFEIDAITLGDFIFVFHPKPEGENWMRLQRHEAVHVDQQARAAPRWARFLPKSVRVWLGAPRQTKAYFEEWQRVGYENNKYEIEARQAE